MAADEMKAQLHRLFREAVTGGKLDVVDELIGPDYVNHDFPDAAGPQGFKHMIATFRAAFPDLVFKVEEVIGEGDRLASRGTWRGTHRGTFMGLPATGRQVTVPFIDVWRVSDDKFVENWVQMDMLGLVRQLGVGVESDDGSDTEAEKEPAEESDES